MGIVPCLSVRVPCNFLGHVSVICIFSYSHFVFVCVISDHLTLISLFSIDGTPSHGGSDSSGIRLRHTQFSEIPTYSASYSSYSPYNSNSTMQSALPVYTPLDIQRMEEESGQSQMMQLIPDQSYLRERADAMSQVESNIVELGAIFNKLAVMVSEHQEMVQRVEDNVDSANDNINFSLAALNDTLTNLRTNKALFLKVFTVLVVFIILFISFFA